MANYKISDAARNTMVERVIHLAMRTVHYAEADFPLDTTDIQDIVLEPSQLERMAQLREEGILTIETHRQIRLAFLRAVTPGITHGLVVAVTLPREIYVPKATQYGMNSTKFEMDERHYIVPNLRRLEPGKVQALSTWIERVVRQKRLFEITSHTVRVATKEKYIPTTGHMYARWPGLIPILAHIDGGERKIRYSNDTGKATHMANWRDKIQNPPRSLKNYRPTNEYQAQFGKLIQVSDTLILAGDMLKPFEHPTGKVHAKGEFWEHLPTDKEYK